ncbi:hypothetical protein KFE25_000515 [Diacronema lutheri]|uniref:Uncharacterized protein n=2 Tax=Diacronema lutheri TaxID=2081491 RepID=A0A8J6CC53_DIALT|nr:hypothetical protein KFE25_000515 [Diacronema lutheri]
MAPLPPSAPAARREAAGRWRERVLQRVPFTSGLVLCFSLVVFGTAFVALEDLNWAIAQGDGGYHVGLRRARVNASAPVLLAELCVEEVVLVRHHLGPWCTCARLGRWVQWMLYSTCTCALLGGALAVASDTHARRTERARRASVRLAQPSVRLSQPIFVGTVVCWLSAWLLLLLSLVSYGSLAPRYVRSSGAAGEPLPLELGGIYVWLRHALAIATCIVAIIFAALLGVWTEADLVHAVVSIIRSTVVTKAAYALLLAQLALAAVVPVRGVGGEAMLSAAGLYALHEQAARPKLLVWYGALLLCLTIGSFVDVVSANHDVSETVLQDAQLGLKLGVLGLLALELWPASPNGRLHSLRRRDTFSTHDGGRPSGRSSSDLDERARAGLAAEMPPWVFTLGWFLWDASYLVTSLADIVSDALVVWQWGFVLGYCGHFRVGVAVFVSTSVWYTLLFVLLLLASASAHQPAAHSASARSDAPADEPTRAERDGRGLVGALAAWVARSVSASRLSALAIFVLLLPFGQVYPFLVYGMLRLAPPERIRQYGMRVLGGPSARLLDDDDFFDWFIQLLPYAPFLVETLCEAIPMSLVQLSAIVSIEHEDDVGLLQLGSIALSVSVIVTRAVMLAFSFSPHVTVFKGLCLACDVLLTFYTVAALFGTTRTYHEATAPHVWFVWFWAQMPAVSPLGVVWCWVWLGFLAWFGTAVLVALLAYAWHGRALSEHERGFSLASRVLANAEPGAPAAGEGRPATADDARPLAERVARGALLLLEDLLLGSALLTLAVGPAVVLLGTLTFAWLVLALSLIEPQYGGPTQPWARRVVSDFVASDLAAKALVRLATVDGVAQCALSAWWPAQLAERERAEQLSRAAQLVRQPTFDLDMLNAALDVRAKWHVFTSATWARFYESLVAPFTHSRALLRAYGALGVCLYVLAKAYTLAFPFLSFFFEQTSTGTISQVTFVAILCCLLGMLLLRRSYERYVLVCSVYSTLLLDLPSILTDTLARRAHALEPPAATAAHGVRKARLTSYSAAQHEASLLARERDAAYDAPGARTAAQPSPRQCSAVESALAERARNGPFLFQEDAPLAALEEVPAVGKVSGGELHSLFIPTAHGEQVLEQLRQRALAVVVRATLLDRALDGRALRYASARERGGEGGGINGTDSADESGALERRDTPSERQVSLALVRELDALYRHMRESDADLLVRVGVERLCMCLFRLSPSSSDAAERAVAGNDDEEDEWWHRHSSPPRHGAARTADAPSLPGSSRTPMFDVHVPAAQHSSVPQPAAAACVGAAASRASSARTPPDGTPAEFSC